MKYRQQNTFNPLGLTAKILSTSLFMNAIR